MDWESSNCNVHLNYIFIIGILRNKYSKHSYLDSIEAIKVSSKDDGSIRHRTINDGDIKQAKNTIFLGIIIDECLTWSEHIAQVVKKISRASSIIVRHFLS